MAFNDSTLILSNAQALTSTSTASTNLYDITGAGSGNAPAMYFGVTPTGNALPGADIGTSDSLVRPTLQMIVKTAGVSGGGATLVVGIQAAPDNGSYSPGTWVTLSETKAFTAAELTAGAMLVLPIPMTPPAQFLPRFYRVYYTIAVSTFSALAVTSQILINPPSAAENVLYPSNFNLAT